MTQGRKSQRPSDKDDRYTTSKADITSATIQSLRPDWTVLREHQDAISILLPELSNEEITIWFGPVNYTWGASVMNTDGDDLGYLETTLDHDKVPASELAQAAVNVIEAWIACGRPSGGVNLAALPFASTTELADSIRRELLRWANDDKAQINTYGYEVGVAIRFGHIQSYSDLHNYCDANTLGDIDRIPEYGEGDENVQKTMDFLNAAQGEVDQWIKSGGLRKFAKEFSRGAMEAAIDIAINAGNLITTSQININDSRDMVNYIIERAEAFERSPLRDGNDYITDIDAFAEHFLKRKYGESDRCSTGKCGHPLKYNHI
jgi:hypothetical protein